MTMKPRASRAAGAWALVVTLLLSHGGQAQARQVLEQPVDASSSEPGARRALEAEGHFRSGVEAYRADRFEDARVHFERSLQALDTVVAAWNLARVYWRLGRPTKALSTIDTLVEGEHGELSPSDEETIRALATDIRERSGELVIAAPTRYEIEIDGLHVAVVEPAAPAHVRLMPGRHLLLAALDRGTERRLLRRSVDLAAAQILEIRLPLAIQQAQAGDTPADHEQRPERRRRWPWLVGGLLIVAGAAAVGLYYGLRGRGSSLNVDASWGTTDVGPG